jgi:hypothetical protein
VTVGEGIGVLAVPGGETAGLDHRHLDAEVGDLVGKRLVQGFQRPLGDVIGAAERHRQQPGDRGELDDVPRALVT